MTVVNLASYKEAKRKEEDEATTHKPVGKGKYKMWRLSELKGLRPKGHPEVLKRGKKGKVFLGVGQVWVEPHNGALWCINKLELRKDGKHTVTLGMYYHPIRQDRVIAESTLRLCMDIWDVAEVKILKAFKKLEASIKEGEGAPYGMNSIESAARFFGIDPHSGHRIED